MLENRFSSSPFIKVKVCTSLFSDQLWKDDTNGDLMSNLNSSWVQNITLTLNTEDNTIAQRELPGNTTIPEIVMVLGIVGKDVKGEPKVENDRAQKWEKGVENMEGWFTLTNLYAQKVLAAVELNSQVDPKILEIQGM